MNKKFTIKEFCNFSYNLVAKYKHFDTLYRQKLVEFHEKEIQYRAYKEYIDQRSTHCTDTVNHIKSKTYAMMCSFKFAQDELRMYKYEMMKWREISQKVWRAYSFIRANVAKQIEGFGTYNSKMRYVGDDVAVNVCITSHKGAGYKHFVLVKTIDEKFGDLSKYEQCF